MRNLTHSLTRCITALKKPGDTMRNMEIEALVDELAEVKSGKVGQTLSDLKAASPVVTLPPTLAEMEA